MGTLINFVTVLAGMTLSLSIGLLMEELIFGRVLCLIFARHAERAKSGQRR